MKNRYLAVLQMVAASLKDKRGNWLKCPIGIIEESHTCELGVKRLKNILEVVLESPSVSDYTKRFLKSQHINAKQLANEIDAENRRRVFRSQDDVICTGINRVTGALARDTEKISSCIAYNDIFDCINNNLESYVNIDAGIAEFVSKFGSSCAARDNLQLNLDTNRRERNKYCGNPEFFAKLEKLRPYLVTTKEEVERDVNEDFEFIGYLNYLLSLAPLVEDGSSRTDRDILMRFLRGEDISADILSMN